MTNYVTSKVAKHVLKESTQNSFGCDDPYFEYVAATDMQGRPTGKFNKRKRPVPPGLTKHEEKVLKKVTRRAHYLDSCISICGFRVGWGALVGIIPGAGDVFDSLMALMVVQTCSQVDIPPSLRSHMMFNVLIDFFIGIVPFLGDIADSIYRCNVRNAALLYKHLEARGTARLRQDENDGRRQSSRTRRGDSRNRHGLQDHDRQGQGGHPPKRATTPPAPHQPSTSNKTATNNEPLQQPSQAPQSQPHVTPNDLQVPEAARTNDSHGTNRGGWLSRFAASKTRGPSRDVEHDPPAMSQRR